MPRGYQIVILGDAAHPECAASMAENTALVVHTAEEEARRIHADNLFVVCQTTIRHKLLDEVTAVFAAAGKHKSIAYHLQCNDTAAEQLYETGKNVIALLSSEGHNSSNTQNSPKSQKPAKSIFY